MEIAFNKETHQYFYSGQRVLSVTQYLHLAGCTDVEFCTEEGRQRGKAVHEAMHYYARNDLDEGTLHPIVKPYVEAGKWFMRETGFVPDLVEHIVFDPVYFYAGTLDMTGTWDLTPGKIIIDWKTGPLQDETALQLAAYEATLFGERHRRWSVALKPNGKYSLSNEYTDRNDIKVFRSKVVSVNWNLSHGKISLERDLAAQEVRNVHAIA
jgi:hypothetical protein